MTVDRRCEEVVGGQQCGRPAGWVVGLPDLGYYRACDEHAYAWSSDCRRPLPGSTPIQTAIVAVIGAYFVQLEALTLAEADVLRDVVAARLARDYLADLGALDEWRERAA